MSIHPLAAQARKCFLAVQAMTAIDMDDWYEANVGYSISADDAALPLVELAQLVAGMMFFHALPNGLETPDAERVEKMLEYVIGHPTDRVADCTTYRELTGEARALACAIDFGIGLDAPTTQEN